MNQIHSLYQQTALPPLPTIEMHLIDKSELSPYLSYEVHWFFVKKDIRFLLLESMHENGNQKKHSIDYRLMCKINPQAVFTCK